MLAVQIHDPDNSLRHGALSCPACNTIHGRCMDAVYPLLHMAKATGQKKYLEAGKAVFEWSKNVSQADGSWTVMPDQNSWKGITVFGSIALAETLHYHGDLLDKNTKDRWTRRLHEAAEYVFKNFDLTFANINYGFSAIYALHLLGQQLDQPRYTRRSRELAKGAKYYFTEQNQLLFGEAKPVDRRSKSGLPPVDLGYNVEESLNGLAQYALAEKDEELLQLIEKSLASHLEFMLPDGGWDNSWGTRQFKWTYWGSRTSDGCQTGYSLLKDRNPTFAQAAFRNTQLLEKCTSQKGLLYGGLHYEQQGLSPCVHHTFAHAKPLAYLLDNDIELEAPSRHLPRSDNYKVRSFPEIATHLASVGPWRGTVTNYDFLYRPDVQQATGGSLSLLWHETVGLLLSASMACYKRVEPYNQQPATSPVDFALTPRIERKSNGDVYSNLFDLSAIVTTRTDENAATIDVSTHLNNSAYQALPEGCHISYTFAPESVSIKIDAPFDACFILPVVSSNDESIDLTIPSQVVIGKPNARLKIQSSETLSTARRTFNMVPGVQALPIKVQVKKNESLHLQIFVESY